MARRDRRCSRSRALAAAWRWTPLRDWVALEALVRMAHALEESPVAPLAVLAAYVVGGLLVVPVTVLIVATGIVFGPLLGAHLRASPARSLSAAVTYSIGGGSAATPCGGSPARA